MPAKPQRSDLWRRISVLLVSRQMVVICEWWHPESTQWDLIFDIVQDKRFLDRIGHLFTEYGTVWLQPYLDAFTFVAWASCP